VAPMDVSGRDEQSDHRAGGRLDCGRCCPKYTALGFHRDHGGSRLQLPHGDGVSARRADISGGERMYWRKDVNKRLCYGCTIARGCKANSKKTRVTITINEVMPIHSGKCYRGGKDERRYMQIQMCNNLTRRCASICSQRLVLRYLTICRHSPFYSSRF